MGSDDWITPKFILDELGTFDLDPCSSSTQPWPTAKTMLTKEDDGLSSPWFGRVFLNPPYGQETWKWLKRLSEHNNGTALIFARTETEMFFNYVWGKCSSILFLKGRLHFHYPNGTRAKFNSGAPSCLVSYDHQTTQPNTQKLAEANIPGALIPQNY